MVGKLYNLINLSICAKHQQFYISSKLYQFFFRLFTCNYTEVVQCFLLVIAQKCTMFFTCNCTEVYNVFYL